MFIGRIRKSCCLLRMLCLIVSPAFINAAGQEQRSVESVQVVEEETNAIQTAPVALDGITLFSVRGVSAYPAEKRAGDIASRIRSVAANHRNAPELLRAEDTPVGTRILLGNQYIMNVLDSDARIEGVHRQVLAQVYLSKIGEAIRNFRLDREPKLLIRRTIYASAATAVLILILMVGNRVARRMRSVLEKRYRDRIHGVQVHSFHVIRSEHLWGLLTRAVTFVWMMIALVCAYVDLHYILALFPWTRGFGNNLFMILVNPIITIAVSLLNSVPDLVFLTILVLVTWYVLKLVRLFFVGIQSGAVTFSGFEAEWAQPTYRLVRVVVIAFALVAAFPYIPGSSSQAFKGVSLLIGVIFSLGSSSLIGNMISGYSMTYRRLFKRGDRVKIGGYIGDVQDTKLMVTYLRTPKNEIIAVPNSEVISGEVINYSTLAETEGLILHTTVGIGYETPWRQVEAMLLQAAERTSGLLRQPKPFVLQKELGDFAVTYQINSYCRQPHRMETLYTDLHQNILDVFNEYGVQIMTPRYEKDPEQPKVVPKAQWYSAPAHQNETELAMEASANASASATGSET